MSLTKLLNSEFKRPLDYLFTLIKKSFDEGQLKNKFELSDYLLLRNLFVATEGISSLYISELVGKYISCLSINQLSNSSSFQFSSLINSLEQTGYAISPPQGLIVDEINNSIEFIDRILSDEKNTLGGQRTLITDLKNLSNIPLVQYLLKDPMIWDMARSYLGPQAIVNGIALSKTEYKEISIQDKSTDAMLFHFDCDHNKFLKIFIYLSDVDRTCGPHVYVPSTHAPYRRFIPKSLQKDGRIDNLSLIDHGLVPNYILGSKGTIIFGDTHCLHRGTPVQSGHVRLMLQLQFVESSCGNPVVDSQQLFINSLNKIYP